MIYILQKMSLYIQSYDAMMSHCNRQNDCSLRNCVLYLTHILSLPCLIYQHGSPCRTEIRVTIIVHQIRKTTVVVTNHNSNIIVSPLIWYSVFPSLTYRISNYLQPGIFALSLNWILLKNFYYNELMFW